MGFRLPEVLVQGFRLPKVLVQHFSLQEIARVDWVLRFSQPTDFPSVAGLRVG